MIRTRRSAEDRAASKATSGAPRAQTKSKPGPTIKAPGQPARKPTSGKE